MVNVNIYLFRFALNEGLLKKRTHTHTKVCVWLIKMRGVFFAKKAFISFDIKYVTIQNK